MIIKKCALGNIVNTFDEKQPCSKPEQGFNGRTGFSAIVGGAKLKPLEPEKYEARGIRKFVRFFSPSR